MDVDGLTGRGDVVDTQDVGSAVEGVGVEGGGGLEGFVGADGEGFGNHRLARDADEDGAAEDGEAPEAGHDGVVLVDGFGKAEAGVDDDVGDTGLLEAAYLALQLGDDRGGDVVAVFGEGLHGGRRAAHVHEDVGAVQVGHGGYHVVVEGATADVVDDVAAHRCDGAACHRGAEGVHRDRDVRGKTAHDFHAAAEAGGLFVVGHRLGAGAGRAGPDVDDVGSLVEHSLHAPFDVGRTHRP